MKVVATISKNSYAEEKVREVVRAGADMLRYNFSHGEPAAMQERITVARAVLKEEGREEVKIIADLPGNKIRLGSFEPNQVVIEKGATYTFITGETADIGKRMIPVVMPDVGSLVEVGDIVLVGDGELSFIVTQKAADSFQALAQNAGPLLTFVGVTLGSAVDEMDHVTEKTRAHIANLAAIEPELVAFSFVRSAEDARRLRVLVEDAWSEGNPEFIAKIETPQGVEKREEIIEEVDWFMVARGDLALTAPYYAMGVFQEQIIRTAHSHNKKVMVATQVLSSLVDSYTPSRAEISDLTQLVRQKADAVVLTKETGVSLTPGHSVEVAKKIIQYTIEHSA